MMFWSIVAILFLLGILEAINFIRDHLRMRKERRDWDNRPWKP